METIAKHIINPSYTETHYHFSLWKRFIAWADGQEKNRFFWLSLAVFGHSCIITMITGLTIALTGNHFIYWPFAIAAIVMSLVSNLAGLPTKITIPIFFLSVLIDIVVIISCCTNGFDVNFFFNYR